MQLYPEQPIERTKTSGEEFRYLEKFVADTIGACLPDCSTNEWFVGTVHFANMVTKLVREIDKS